MERKFRLIKKYPNCGIEVGKVVTFSNDACSWTIEIPDYPEFWEEIIEVEKEYEILSFSYPKQWGNRLAKLLPSGKYSTLTEGGWSLNQLLNEGSCVKSGDVKIHSVKRLSDGEIFTVGDFIGERFKPKKIIEIKVREGKEDSYKEGAWVFYGGRNSSHINYIKKFKQPLFVTEDGKDIFEGDDYFPVERGNLYLHNKQHHPFCSNDEKFIIFSTKEKAEEYIKLNKPEFSRNQIIKLLEELSE